MGAFQLVTYSGLSGRYPWGMGKLSQRRPIGAKVIGLTLFVGPFLAMLAALVVDISDAWLKWSAWEGALVAGAMSASLLAGFMLTVRSSPRN